MDRQSQHYSYRLRLEKLKLYNRALVVLAWLLVLLAILATHQ